eukprot:scaffold27386_cov28-Tisochrysis_lutea.AAC.6
MPPHGPALIAQAAYGAISLLSNALKMNGRMLFAERGSVGFPNMCREFGLQVEYESEGGFDVGIATRRSIVRTSRRKQDAKVKQTKRPMTVDPTKGGFGAAVGKKPRFTSEERAAERARRAA